MLAFSCKEKADSPAPKTETPAATKTDMLTAKMWDLTSFSVAGANILPADDECEKDDFYKFSAATSAALTGTVIMNVGALKCEEGDVNSTGTWMMNTEQTQITITAPGEDTIIITELKITDKIMTGKSSFDGIAGDIGFTAM